MKARALCLLALMPVMMSAAAPSAPVSRESAGFAARLAERGLPPVWLAGELAHSVPWPALAMLPRAERQDGRWQWARHHLATGRAADALGVLEVMQAQEPDLMLVGAFRLARGAALTGLGRGREALAALAHPLLAHQADACAWRVRAYMLDGAGTGAGAEAALAAMPCALPAINGRKGADRRPFLLAAIRAALIGGRQDDAARWLALLPDGDAAANVLRGQMLLATGKAEAGRLRLKRVLAADNGALAAEARLALAGEDRAALDRFLLSWRGDALEAEALARAYRLARARGDMGAQLRHGAALLRYGPARPQDGQKAALLAEVQQILREGMEGKASLVAAADRIWDYRDLLPTGAEGAALSGAMAARLEQAGLYGRAAELLSHRLDDLDGDVAAGPMALRAAMLWLQADRPDRALAVLRASGRTPFPPGIMAERTRVEAVALARMGRAPQALALLADLPDSGALAREIAWSAGLWADYRAVAGTGGGDDMVLLRRAIATAMLGDAPALAAMAGRAAMVRDPAKRRLYMLLTGPVDGGVEGGGAKAALDALAALDVPASDDQLVRLAGRAAATPKGGR